MPEPTPAAPPPRRRRSARRDQGPPAPAGTTVPTPDPAPGATTACPAAGPDDRAGRLRKRPRRRSPGASPMPVGQSPDPAPAPSPTATPTPPPAAGGRDRRVDHTERALRGLVTTRGTQVSWSAATRARAVAMPDADDLAQAAEEIVIVHRHYTPPEPLRNARPADAPRPRRRPG